MSELAALFVAHYDRRAMAETCVVYLVWGPLGIQPVERFAASYRAHDAHLTHSLVALLNGVEDERLRSSCARISDDLGAQVLELEKRVLDLDAYLMAAGRLEAQTLLFLNSHSEVLVDGWLARLHAALTPEDVGLVGATGSYESGLSAAPRPLKPFLRRSFPPFPNPHLRTNAFMLERELLLDLDWPASPSKRRALALESGKRSLTRQVWERGLGALVVDRTGCSYGPERWMESRTFRYADQENLLIADNRTRQYVEATPSRRLELARYAWGTRYDRPRGATFRPRARSHR